MIEGPQLNELFRPGPYASAILRFQIRFPPTYPDLPPLVTFGTDIFHPLLVPLTTYTFTTGSSDTDTVSATDEERLPPGGFSLRHGFPYWFGRAKRSVTNSATSSRTVSGNASAAGMKTAREDDRDTSSERSGAQALDGESISGPPLLSTATSNMPRDRISPAPTGEIYSHGGIDVPVLNLLDYIRRTFDEEEFLDSIPLEAAGNPGAWHAWRSHRHSVKGTGSDSQIAQGGRSGALSPGPRTRKGNPQSRSPGEWNWAGVWEKRVQTGIQNSYLESVLFGNPPRSADDLVNHTHLAISSSKY